MCKVEGRALPDGSIVLCPDCLGFAVEKGGKAGGRQRYRCKAAGCGRVFIGKTPWQFVGDAARKEVRKVAVKLAAGGVSVAVIADATGIPLRTIYHDIKNAKCHR
nr:hypothetical protein 8 [Deltaproteobacteria bacterium]